MAKAKLTRKGESAGRQRLARLLDALPVFAGYVTPDGELAGDFDSPPGPLHIARAGSAEWLWDMPAFAGLPGAGAQLRTLCARAAAGHALQVELPYLSGANEPRLRRRGLLSLSPRLDEDGLVAELAVTLVDCDRHGLPPRSLYQPARTDRANARLSQALSVAQAVILASHKDSSDASRDAPRDAPRDSLTMRLHVIGGTADVLSQMDRDSVPLSELAQIGLRGLDALAPRDAQHSLDVATGDVPMSAAPLLSVLLHELAMNARQHGCWRDDTAPGTVRLSWSKADKDQADGRGGGCHATLRWTETSDLATPQSGAPGFGMRLVHDILHDVGGIIAQLAVGPSGHSWTFTWPVEAGAAAGADFARFDGGYAAEPHSDTLSHNDSAPGDTTYRDTPQRDTTGQAS